MAYIDINKLLARQKKTVVVDINKSESKTITQESNVKKYILNFKGISSPDVLTTAKNGRDLIITSEKTSVTVKNYFSKDGKSTSSKVTTLRFNSNTTTDVALLDALTISSSWLTFNPNKKGVVSGTVFSDTINMDNVLTAPLNSKNKGLTINSGRGNDIITGTQYNDTISGGKGINTYNYDFGVISGQDVIKLTKGETLKLNLTKNETPLSPSNLSFGKLSNHLIIFQKESNTSNQITINNYFKTSATVEIGGVKLSDYLTSDEFEGLNIFGKGKFSGTDVNDIIYGSAGNDIITAKKGDDEIYTKGGKDTVVETGVYGHDVINSDSSTKVTVKLSSFDANNLTYGEDDLTYTTDENSSFVYKDFVSGKTADLWIKAGKTSYYVKKETSDVVDLSKEKSNNVLFLTGENQEYIGSKKGGTNVIYSLDGENIYTTSGGKDTIVDSGEDNDSYTATVLKSTKLVINDDGGNDNLILTNNVKDLVLYFNIDKNETLSDATDLVIYSKSAMTYSNIVSALKSGSYAGALDIKNYFADGNLEVINIKDTEFDIEGWKYFVTSEVGDFLKDNNLNSAQDVFLNGTKAQKTALLKVFKNSNYQAYLNVLGQSLSVENTKFVKNGDDLNVVIALESEKESITTVKDFFKDGVVNDNLGYYALNENDELRKYIIGSTDLPIYINGEEETAQGTNYSDYVLVDGAKTINLQKGDDTVEFADSTQNISVTTADGSKDTFIFEDKKYTDFYTKGTLSGAYSAGDPLIKKDGDDLKIGNITVKDIDGNKNEIQIVDMEGNTKNIIIGQGTINGTHESEIIIGSNSVDTIYSNGRNDLIYMGDGNDTLKLTSTIGDETGKNTAEMIGIGGTHSISNDLDVPAISVYDSKGNDTYNITLKDFGLYIEDYAGNDTLNITYSDNNLMYLFDVVNPKHASENPTLYTDLMICDKSQFMAAGMDALTSSTSAGMKAMMEDMQGTFGYAWIDDHFGGAQKIENINLIDADGNSSALDIDSAIASTQAKIAAWLSSDSGFFKPSKDFATAWDVLESGSKIDKAYLANLYMS